MQPTTREVKSFSTGHGGHRSILAAAEAGAAGAASAVDPEGIFGDPRDLMPPGNDPPVVLRPHVVSSRIDRLDTRVGPF